MKFSKSKVQQVCHDVFEEIDGKWQKVGGLTVGGGLMVSAPSAFAVAPTTIAELTAGISFADVSLGILAVAGLMVTLYVGWRAAKFVIAAVKGL